MSPRTTNPIDVPGTPPDVDSFAACLQAVLNHWGREVAYDCLAGLSGTAFSPSLDRKARCPGQWMEAGADIRVEFLGHAMGFTAQRGSGAELCRRDGVVLCKLASGWNIVTSAANGGGAYVLAGPAGTSKLSELPAEARVYLLQPTERSLTNCEALRAAVEFGALLASGACATNGIAFGGQVYDAWIDRLSQGPFCPDCGENEWRCAERTAGRARRTQLSAVRFLNRAYALLPPDGNSESLRHASDAFAAMAGTLAPYGEGQFRQVWQDSSARTLYAADVARVRDLHKQAARHLFNAARRP